jgi:hypothetical protein
MSKNRQAPEPIKESAASSDIKLSLLGAAVSATLRMAVPVFGLFFVGLLIDFALTQAAFYAVIGAVVGFVVAAGLIYLQIKQLRATGRDTLISDDGTSDYVKAEKSAKHDGSPRKNKPETK